MSFYWIIIYNALVIPVLFVLVNILRFVNSKIETGIQGRASTWGNLKRFIKTAGKAPRVLVHSASLGEFEQAKPIIQGIKKIKPDWKIIASFASPSGFKHAQRLKEVDLWIYLPFDTWYKMRKFIQLLRPRKIIFTSYELWPNLIYHANRHHIPTYLASARVREKSSKFKPIVRGFFKDLYRSVSYIYAISEKDRDLINSLIGSARVKVLTTGDTRFDQVVHRAENARGSSDSPLFSAGKVFIAGSVWPADQSVLMPALLYLLERYQDLKVIIAPHEPTHFAVESIEEDFKQNHIRTARISEKKPDSERVVIVNQVGYLAELYHQAHIAFIGGSFRAEVHNVMEPAVAALPVIFGPFYHNSREAEFLLEAGGAILVNNSEEMKQALERLLTDPIYYKKISRNALQFVYRNIGASARIVQEILSHESD